MNEPVAKTPSETATSMAGRMVNFNPFTEDSVDELTIKLTGQTLKQPDKANMVEALRATFQQYVDDAQSIAGALLRLDPVAGQGGGD